MMHIPESSRGEAFHPVFVIAPSCQQSASHLSHSRVRLSTITRMMEAKEESVVYVHFTGESDC